MIQNASRSSLRKLIGGFVDTFLTRRREDAKGRREEAVRKPVNISLFASFAASREMVLSFSRYILNHRGDPECTAVVVKEVNRGARGYLFLTRRREDATGRRDAIVRM